MKVRTGRGTQQPGPDNLLTSDLPLYYFWPALFLSKSNISIDEKLQNVTNNFFLKTNAIWERFRIKWKIHKIVFPYQLCS